jgi:hypothetical protein
MRGHIIREKYEENTAMKPAEEKEMDRIQSEGGKADHKSNSRAQLSFFFYRGIKFRFSCRA